MADKAGSFVLQGQDERAVFLIENEAYEGVKRIGQRVALDVELVTGMMPEIMQEAACCGGSIVLFATVGKSPCLKRLEEAGKWTAGAVSGKREVYGMQVVEAPFPEQPQIKRALVIAGSDKRGTIYGMFRLSEFCGVSPLVYWGDAAPEKKDALVLSIGEGFVSKEPSVRYRGFFINDEWPAFGNWCMEHFGGFNARVYEEVFILLLRLKGNYLWPAMWSATFSEDGPGLENAVLADTYGVIMGASHHEPMCRAGEEWQHIYRNYGQDNTWSFLSNREAITEFWKDGILRNKPFENVITIGMRGECDSKLLPEDAGLKDNIQVIKEAILTQHELLRKYIDPDLKKIPRMLAIYKEVEEYYYGDETCEGLKGWEELDDVILMLCEDNFGNTRGLPNAADRKHPGGYGMYYHFDYHGAPVSYEWQNSSRLTKTWEQMTQAYEYGVRELWIVNVGDLKGVEYPLCYFMDLAYDYETYSAKNMTEQYAQNWIRKQFGGRLSGETSADLLKLLEGFTRWNAARRPETMEPGIYHPCHFREGERVWNEVNGLMELAEKLKDRMPEDCMNAYCSMLYYPAMASLNLILMHIEAGWNEYYAGQGNIAANGFGSSVKQRVEMDHRYVQAYHSLAGGKWNHMMDSAHTGFQSWDDHHWTYPVVREVIPIPRAKMLVQFRGQEGYHVGNYWQDKAYPCNDDFTRPDTESVVIDIGSRGSIDFDFQVRCDKPWAKFSRESGSVRIPKQGAFTMESVTVTCDRSLLKESREKALIEVCGEFADGQKVTCSLHLVAEKADFVYDAGTYVEKQGYLAMEAKNYTEKRDVEGEGFALIDHLGRMEAAVKAFPVTKSWIGAEEVPWLKYTFAAARNGAYKVQFYLAPRNPVEKGARMRLAFSVNGEEKRVADTVPEVYYTEFTCKTWNQGVMNNIRIIEETVRLQEGVNNLYFYAADPGIVLERIVLYPEGTKLPESYLGPVESWRQG